MLWCWWCCAPVDNIAHVECVVCGSHVVWACVVTVQYVSALIMTKVVLRPAEEHCVSRDRTVRVCKSGLGHALRIALLFCSMEGEAVSWQYLQA